jgi:hypothetical protein
MSVVTSIILKTFLDEDKAIDYINETVGLNLTDATELHEGTAGTKYMQISVYLAAFNHWNPGPFLTACLLAPWRNPQDVQLFINGENSHRIIEVHPMQETAITDVLAAMGRVD